MLFVCIGNICRSPMAEAFANHYGSDVLQATSAGLAPVPTITSDTVRAMAERNVDVSGHIPMLYDPRIGAQQDLVVNMAGFRLPGIPPRGLVEWKVTDPYRAGMDVFRTVRDDIETRVMRLILELRKAASSPRRV